MSFGRTHFAAVYVNGGKIFVFGGRNSETGILRENEFYDIKNAKWSTIRPLEFGRCCHDASVVKSDVVLTGGYVQVERLFRAVDINCLYCRSATACQNTRAL